MTWQTLSTFVFHLVVHWGMYIRTIYLSQTRCVPPWIFLLRNTFSCSWLTENICVLEDKDKTTSDTYLLWPAYPAISHSKLFLQLKLIIWTAQNVGMIELIVMPLGDGYIGPHCSDNSLLCQTYFFFDNAVTKLSRVSDEYTCQWIESSLVQVTISRPLRH